MSRIGKTPITIPEKVTVSLADNVFIAKGPAGEVKLIINKKVKIVINDKEKRILVSVANPKEKLENSIWGTTASLVNNAVLGVSEPFKKQLEINGVGFGWEVSGQKLVIKAGFSHPIEYSLPASVKGTVQKNVLTLESPDKHLLGQVTAEIRTFRKPEPYKGKGIKYIDEHIIRKVGKQVAGAEGGGA